MAREVFGVGLSSGLAFDALLHFATALAVLLYFRADVATLLRGTFRGLTGSRAARPALMQALAIVLGTIPAVVLGYFLEGAMETLFRSAALVGLSLIVGSGIMYAAERVVRRRATSNVNIGVGPREGVIIGLFQALALIPGMSRSGMSLSGGIFMGLSREAAARFAFLLSLPVLFGAGLKKIADLVYTGAFDAGGAALFLGAAAAFVSGLAVIHWLMRYLRTRTLMPFVWHRLGLAYLIFLFLM